MPKYIQFYKDAACSELWAAVPVAEVAYTSIYGNVVDVAGYSARDSAYIGYLDGVEVIKTNPFLTYSRETADQRYYCKNGFSIEFGMSSSYSVFRNYMYDGQYLNFADMGNVNNEWNHPRYWAIGFNAGGKHYIGFTRATDPNTWSGYIPIISAVEDSFWESALRPPYDYGQGQDPDGGQGSGGGTFRRTGVDDTSPPAGLIPTSASGRGLHAYVISATNYGDLQNYLWGDSSTTAKALWQKFQNKIHSPASCIVAVYALPADFMPTGGTAVNIRLAGITLPVTAHSVQLDFASYEVTFDPIDKPFHNFADYSHVTCKMYVPYCGEIPIPVEAAYGRTIKCRYWVDQFNGNMVARVSCGDINIGELSSNVAYRIPIIGGDDGSLDRIGAALTGIAQVSAGNYSGALGSAAEMATAPYTAQIINADFSGSISACTFRRPYIEWTANETYYSDEFLRTRGVPARYAATLSSFSGGYLECITKVNSVNIPSATDAEREEIESILRGGLFA